MFRSPPQFSSPTEVRSHTETQKQNKKLLHRCVSHATPPKKRGRNSKRLNHRAEQIVLKEQTAINNQQRSQPLKQNTKRHNMRTSHTNGWKDCIKNDCNAKIHKHGFRTRSKNQKLFHGRAFHALYKQCPKEQIVYENIKMETNKTNKN